MIHLIVEDAIHPSLAKISILSLLADNHFFLASRMRESRTERSREKILRGGGSFQGHSQLIINEGTDVISRVDLCENHRFSSLVREMVMYLPLYHIR
jgi:hypothetical protein